MKPPAIFRIVVASFGLGYFLQGTMILLDAVTCAIRIAEPPLHSTMYSMAVRGTFGMLVGFLLMGGIPGIIKLAFPAEVAAIESDEDADEES
ncbi:MAG: hypothetical protein B7Z73_02660 [Planctomycetia bacterium 21-64-5]|nr:MAG: hypothetical protein B7Z73_02660 [Planctomycetia bacterium 21-64-5]HQU42907.1 hypothetical protein [Pirellulales bacterium]